MAALLRDLRKCSKVYKRGQQYRIEYRGRFAFQPLRSRAVEQAHNPPLKTAALTTRLTIEVAYAIDAVPYECGARFRLKPVLKELLQPDAVLHATDVFDVNSVIRAAL